MINPTEASSKWSQTNAVLVKYTELTVVLQLLLKIYSSVLSINKQSTWKHIMIIQIISQNITNSIYTNIHISTNH